MHWAAMSLQPHHHHHHHHHQESEEQEERTASGVAVEVVAAFDLNDVANRTYRLNFPSTPVRVVRGNPYS